MSKGTGRDGLVWHEFTAREFARMLGLPKEALRVNVSFTRHVVRVFCGERDEKEKR